MVNAGIWGFLSGGLSGAAAEMFNRADPLEGLDAWRRVTRYITNGRGIRRETLRQAVKNIHFKQMKTLEQVEVGVAEFENLMEEYSQAGGSRPTDNELKLDLLHILPGELSELLLVTAASEGISFHAFRDLVTVQAGNILMNRQKAPIHSVVASDDRAPPLVRDQRNDEDDESYDGMLAALNKVWEGRFAKKPAGAGGARREPSSQPRSPNTDRPRKCPNCSETHESKVCPKPSVDMKDRACHECGKTGHYSRNCPSKQRAVKAIEDGPLAAVTFDGIFDGCFAVGDSQGFQHPKKTGRPTPRTIGLHGFMSAEMENRFDVLSEKAPESVEPSESTLMSCEAELGAEPKVKFSEEHKI